jgi:hypothetical protein
MVFTRKEELHKSLGNKTRFNVLPYRAIYKMVVQDSDKYGGIGINQKGCGQIIPRSTMAEAEIRGAGLNTKPVDRSIGFGVRAMRKYPPGIEEALSHTLGKCRNVYEAYLLEMKPHDADNPHALLYLDMDGGNKTVYPYAVDTIRRHLGENQAFQLMRVEECEGLIHVARKIARPLIKRERPAAPAS